MSSLAEIKAVCVLLLQKQGLRPSAAEIKSREVITLHGAALLSVRRPPTPQPPPPPSRARPSPLSPHSPHPLPRCARRAPRTWSAS